MEFGQESIVALAAIAGSVATTWLGVRGQRRAQHDDRLWLKRAETYEQYLTYSGQLMAERSRQLTEPTELVDPDPADDVSDFPMLNRLAIYASRPALRAAQRADLAHGDWLAACADWQGWEGHDGDPAKREEAEAQWESANAAATDAIEVIRQEMILGRPRRMRLPWHRPDLAAR